MVVHLLLREHLLVLDFDVEVALGLVVLDLLEVTAVESEVVAAGTSLALLARVRLLVHFREHPVPQTALLQR